MTGSPDPDPTLEDLCAYLDANGVSKTRWPERPDVVVAMPLTATRKIVKGKLIARSRPEYRILQATDIRMRFSLRESCTSEKASPSLTDWHERRPPI